MKNWYEIGAKKDFLFVFLLMVFHYFVKGYSFGVDDQVLQIPLLKLSINPDLYPLDLLHSFTPYQFTYFFKVFGLLLPMDHSLEYLYFIGYLLSFGFAMLIFIKIATELVCRKESAYLAAVILASGYYPTLPWAYFDSFFSHRTFAFPFFLASIYLFLRHRYLLSLLLVGLVWNIHGLHSLHLTLIFLSSLWIQMKVLGWKKVLGLSILLFIPASPVILWRILSLESFSLEPWRTMIKILAGNQLFPLSWPSNTPLRVGTFLLYLALALKSTHLLERELRLFFSAILVMCLGGFLFSEIFPLRLMIEAQFMRSTVFFYLLSLPFVTHYLLVKNERGDLLTKMMVSLSIASFISREVEFIFLPSLFFLMEEMFHAVRNLMRFRLILFLSILIGEVFFVLNGFGILGASLYRFNLLPKTILIFLTSFLALMVHLSLQKMIEEVKFSNSRLYLLVAIGVITGISYSFLTHQSPVNLQESNWKDIQLWVKENTDRNESFITPIYLSGFRVYSERGVVVEWYDGFWGPFFSTELSVKWWERMKDFGITEENFRDRESVYSALREEDFLKIGEKYRASYVITLKPKILQFKKLFENEKFFLYALP